MKADPFAQYRKDGELADPDGCYCKDELELVHGGLLKFCGCGAPEDAMRFLRDMLAHIADDRREAMGFDAWYKEWTAKESAIYGPPAARWLFLYLLDTAGLAEHGSSVNSCWLTDKGKHILELLRAIEFEEPAAEETR